MLRVAIIDREGFNLEAVKALLASQPDIELAGAASDLEACQEAAAAADVTLLQQAETPAATLRMIESLRQQDPTTRIVIFSASDDRAALLDYLEAGARGYALHDDTSEHLLNVVRVVATGEALIGPALVGPLLDRLNAMRELVQRFTAGAQLNIDLGPRKQEIAALLAAHYSDEEISAALELDLAAVRRHVTELMAAYGVDDRRHVGVLYRLFGAGPAQQAGSA